MAVTGTGKRRISVGGTDYFRYVSKEADHLGCGALKTLTIMSGDKTFHVKCPLFPNYSERFVIMLGSKFGGNGEFGGCWKRVLCPHWPIDEAIMPNTVRQIIVWALEPKENRLVNFAGQPL